MSLNPKDPFKWIFVYNSINSAQKFDKWHNFWVLFMEWYPLKTHFKVDFGFSGILDLAFLFIE